MRRRTVVDPQAATPAAPRSRDSSACSALDHARERTRGWIAIALFAPLSIGFLIAVLALVLGRITVAELKELLASLNLGTLIALAMGFYFGRSTK
jgi:hypothetical protein